MPINEVPAVSALNQQVVRLTEQWKFQAAIPIAEKALEAAKRARGPEHPETAAALNNLGFLFEKIGVTTTKLNRSLRKRSGSGKRSWALTIPRRRQASTTWQALNDLALLYHAMREFAKAELTAEDVSTLDLRGTWLVTLSACDTGSGEARAGEGVMGLRRGFIQVGAQNLLMTLWPISDEVTVQIMSDFYEAAYKTGTHLRP